MIFRVFSFVDSWNRGTDQIRVGRATLPGLLRGLTAGSASEIVAGLISHLSRNSAEINPADDVSLIVMKMTSQGWRSACAV